MAGLGGEANLGRFVTSSRPRGRGDLEEAASSLLTLSTGKGEGS